MCNNMPGVCKFYKNLGANLKFYAPEEWHTASSMLGINKYLMTLLQNLVTKTTWRPEFVHLCTMWICWHHLDMTVHRTTFCIFYSACIYTWNALVWLTTDCLNLHKQPSFDQKAFQFTIKHLTCLPWYSLQLAEAARSWAYEETATGRHEIWTLDPRGSV
jgi:hypothetical protein